LPDYSLFGNIVIGISYLLIYFRSFK